MGGRRGCEVRRPIAAAQRSPGPFYIQIQNQLLEHTAEGEFVRRHDLGELGVDPLIGAAAFFSNGDILLRRGTDGRGFFDQVAAYQRRENDSDLVPETPGAGLARCSLQTQQCTPFAKPPIDFKATIGVYVDQRTDEVYISDTSRHTLRKYSSDGIELGEPMRGFKFPNQLLLHDNQLLVADTNHHQVRIVEPRTGLFGKTLRSVDVVPADAQRVGLRWPSHFARIGDKWWVNNMNTHMQDGGIYLFDDEWQYERRIPLPEHADPISILPFASGALVSDWYNDRVYRVSARGTVLEDFASPGLEAMLAESREKRTFYRALSWMGYVLLGAVFIGLITKAILSPAKKEAAVAIDAAAAMDLASDELIWFEPDPKTLRKIRRNNTLAGVALLGAAVISLYLGFTHDNAEFVLKMLPLVGSLVLIYAFIYWMSRANLGTAIGFQRNDIILRDHNGVESRCPVTKAVYDKVAIATPDMAVVLGQQPMPIYKPDLVEQQILPRLANAQPISGPKMQGIMIRLKHPQALLILLALVGLAAAGAYSLIR